MAPMPASMTGFARSEGRDGALSWSWELRSVNGRGLDVRFRLPPGFDAIEPALREAAGKLLKRGNVNANLTAKREDAAQLVADPAALEQVLAQALALQARIPGSPAPRAEALLALPGVLKATTEAEADPAAAQAAVTAGFHTALKALAAARQAEGARTAQVLRTLLAEITDLHATASAQAAEQPQAHRAKLMESLHALLGETPKLPEERIAQEIALLTTRSDVREELDRLQGHIEAAHALLGEGTNIGRRFDFLVQEFNREANTLCSKSTSQTLTATGLRLKAAIEQLREQVQNIE
jgi:uncharacterized protein (TIGR00255 family)